MKTVANENALLLHTRIKHNTNCYTGLVLPVITSFKNWLISKRGLSILLYPVAIHIQA